MTFHMTFHMAHKVALCATESGRGACRVKGFPKMRPEEAARW